MREGSLVARVRELFSDRIGDDAAIVGNQVLTTDMLIEDVDFTPAMPLRFVARKSLAVNLSDIAAMGAAPDVALLSLGLPERAMDGIDAMLQAYAEAAREHGIEIVGGDFSRAEKLTVSVTAIGHLVTRALLRSGARPGDRIFVSRPLGGSSAGLQLLLRGEEGLGKGYAEREFIQSAIRRHADPEPELALGVALAAIPEVTSCIDVSDGLSTDLHHLCRASGVGAEIEKERIPVFAELPDFAPRLGIDVREAVLNGGEEYALLFTSSLRESEMSRAVGRPVYSIGRITRDPSVVLKMDGLPAPLVAGGWDHFA
jgi:thiamine-monophosphate kinase